MKTKSLLKLALITAILGTFVVIILANNLEPSAIAISSINEKMLDEWVSIQGKVVDEQIFGDLHIITIKDDSASIRALLPKKTSFLLNKEVVILGKVIEYRNELEVEISRIKIKN